MEKTVTYVVKTSGSTKLNPKTINIDGSEDPFYRYKMRQLYVQVVGKGKMIKTVLLNIDDIAKDLRVPPAYLNAFLGYETGAQSKYDGKKPDRERAYLSGALDGGVLSECVKKFINEIVLCQNCRLPETSMSVEKKTEIVATCRGCGTKSELKLGDKFKSFVLNHPIKAITSKEERAVKKKQEEATQDVSSPEPKPTKTKAKSKKKKKIVDDDDDDVEWSCSTTEEAVRERRAKLLPDVAKLSLEPTQGKEEENGNGNNEDEEESKDPCSALETFLKENPQGDIAAEVKRLQKEFGFPNSKRPHLLFEVLFSESLPDVNKQLPIFKDLIEDQATQMGLLVCLERLTAEEQPLLKKLPSVFHAFYDNEILEEETFLKWNQKKTTSPKVKKEVAPFIQWLQEAEEDIEEAEADE